MKKYNKMKVNETSWDLNYRINDKGDKVIYFWGMNDCLIGSEIPVYAKSIKRTVKFKNGSFKVETPGLKRISVTL